MISVFRLIDYGHGSRNERIDPCEIGQHARYCFDGGGGSTGTTQTVTNVNQAPWTAQQPYLKDVFSEAQGLYQSNIPQFYPESTVTPLGPESLAALEATQRRAIQGSDVQQIGRDQFNFTQAGGYLNANPFLQGAIGAATRPLERNYQETTIPGIASQFIGSGRFGSEAYGGAQDRAFDTHQQNLADVASRIAYGNYRDERGIQNQAVLQAPQYSQADFADIARLGAVGAARETEQDAFLQDQIARHNFGQTTPAAKLGQYSAAIGGPMQGQIQSTELTPFFRGNPAAGALGGAASGAAAGTMFSPGVGTAIGAGLGGLGGLKIICEELHRQGLLPTEIYEPDEAYGDWLEKNDPAVLLGYHFWARPVVARMRASRGFAKFMAVVSRPVALELGRRMGVGRGSILGRAMLFVGVPVCRLIGIWEASRRAVGGNHA